MCLIEYKMSFEVCKDRDVDRQQLKLADVLWSQNTLVTQVIQQQKAQTQLEWMWNTERGENGSVWKQRIPTVCKV